MILNCSNEANSFNFQGVMHVTNYTISEQFIPTILLVDDIKFFTLLRVVGKVPVQKNMVHLFTYKVFGEVNRE
jgi:hypothetical protein